MQLELTAMDIHLLTKEFKILENGRIDKIYLNEDDFLFKIQVPNIGKKFLRILFPKTIYLTEYKADYPETPGGFCMFLRKYLKNAKIIKIYQKEFERIIILDLIAKGETYQLIFELFSKGNCILIKENIIKGLYKNQTWADRTLRGGIKYEPPPENLNPLTLSKENFIDEIKNSPMDNIVKKLAKTFSLGKYYAEELCERSNVDKNSNIVDEKSLEKIEKNFRILQNEKIDPISTDKRPFPFKLSSIESKNSNHKTFSDVIDEFLAVKVVKTEKKSKKESKLDVILKEQKNKISGFKKSVDENKQIGETIYNNYVEIQEILKNVNKLINKKSLDKEELKKQILVLTNVKNFNPKDKTITINL